MPHARNIGTGTLHNPPAPSTSPGDNQQFQHPILFLAVAGFSIQLVPVTCFCDLLHVSRFSLNFLELLSKVEFGPLKF